MRKNLPYALQGLEAYCRDQRLLMDGFEADVEGEGPGRKRKTERRGVPNRRRKVEARTDPEVLQAVDSALGRDVRSSRGRPLQKTRRFETGPYG